MGKTLVQLIGIGFLALLSSFAQRRDPLEYIQILESADRVKKLQVERVIEALDVQPGQKVADLGAGSGLFTRPLARSVGSEGVVFAIDIDRDLLDHVEETAREQNLSNIETVLASELDPQIPDKVDVVLICDTLHQIKEKEVYLRDLTRYLRPTARVAIIDYGDNWPKRLRSNKYSIDDLNSWMRRAGFKKQKVENFLEGNFFVIYSFVPDRD